MNWLFLRGKWDERTQNSIDSDDDMWIQLFAELVDKKDTAIIMFWGATKRIDYADNISIVAVPSLNHMPKMKGTDIVFARGGFAEYDLLIDECVNAKKIYYGAGRRFAPKENKYDLILVDTLEQKYFCENDPILNEKKSKIELFIKPFARHFTYWNIEKKYDLCFIANGTQEKIKGIQWVYETIPKEISCLHLGYKSSFKKPDNVTQIRTDRILMPAYINQCRLGIVPYFDHSIDSCPRVVPEMLGCGLPVFTSDNLVIDNLLYPTIPIKKEELWDAIKSFLTSSYYYEHRSSFANEKFSIEVSASDIKNKIRSLS